VRVLSAVFLAANAPLAKNKKPLYDRRDERTPRRWRAAWLGMLARFAMAMIEKYARSIARVIAQNRSRRPSSACWSATAKALSKTPCS
jgi:hypothetical protein